MFWWCNHFDQSNFDICLNSHNHKTNLWANLSLQFCFLHRKKQWWRHLFRSWSQTRDRSRSWSGKNFAVSVFGLGRVGLDYSPRWKSHSTNVLCNYQSKIKSLFHWLNYAEAYDELAESILRRCAQPTQLFSKNATTTANRLQPHVRFDQTKNEPRTP